MFHKNLNREDKIWALECKKTLCLSICDVSLCERILKIKIPTASSNISLFRSQEKAQDIQQKWINLIKLCIFQLLLNDQVDKNFVSAIQYLNQIYKNIHENQAETQYHCRELQECVELYQVQVELIQSVAKACLKAYSPSKSEPKIIIDENDKNSQLIKSLLQQNELLKKQLKTDEYKNCYNELSTSEAYLHHINRERLLYDIRIAKSHLKKYKRLLAKAETEPYVEPNACCIIL